MSEEESQQDPVTRGQFLALGFMGSIMGALLTIPPVVYFLDPSIKTVALGKSDVPDDWVELASVYEIPEEDVLAVRTKFTQKQTYKSGVLASKPGELVETALVSWHDGKRPESIRDKTSGTLGESEIKELSTKLNVMSNACAHLGCPTRWRADRGQILCPCHGGIYSINGTHVGGPPPHGLWRYIFQVREDGSIRIKHKWEQGRPWVV